MSHRRRLPFAPGRLRRATRPRAAAHRGRGARRPPLHGAGGARHRPAQQAQGVRAAGGGPRHRRGEPRARLPGGRAGVGDRQPDPRRPGADDHPHPHQQPAQARRHRGLRSDRRRTGAARGSAARRERALPADEAGQARPPPASPGHAARAGRRVTQETSQGWPDRSAENVLAPEPEPGAEAVPAAEPEAKPEPQPELEAVPLEEPEPAEEPHEHAAGDIDIPDDVDVLEGEAGPTRRLVAVVVSKFNGDITTQLLASAFAELDAIGVARSQLTVVPVPGAFELPIAAMALAKTRRYLCVIALGCVIRGETPHFDYVASEAASGLQLAGLETGIPVSFGVLTCDTREQAEARVSKGADAVRAALEMADLFSQLRTAAAG